MEQCLHTHCYIFLSNFITTEVANEHCCHHTVLCFFIFLFHVKNICFTLTIMYSRFQVFTKRKRLLQFTCISKYDKSNVTIFEMITMHLILIHALGCEITQLYIVIYILLT